MKKVLFATTALALSAGIAAADVSLSGYGRFGLATYSANDGDESKTWTEQRLRLNITASTQSDSGVEFGAKFRIQYDDGDEGAGANNAQFYFVYEGLTVQVGNVTTALDEDTADVFYGSELGLTDTSFGDSRSAFFAYGSKAYDGARSGIYGKYAISDFTIEASYIDPNQYSKDNLVDVNGVPTDTGISEETSLVLSYASGPITLATGATWDGAGVSDNNIWYVGGAYAFSDMFKAGLTYIDEGEEGGYDLGKTITLYGSYATGPVEVKAYVAQISDYDDVFDATYTTDTAFGIGGAYDLGGGVSLLGGVHRDYAEEGYGELGVKFKF